MSLLDDFVEGLDALGEAGTGGAPTLPIDDAVATAKHRAESERLADAEKNRRAKVTLVEERQVSPADLASGAAAGSARASLPYGVDNPPSKDAPAPEKPSVFDSVSAFFKREAFAGIPVWQAGVGAVGVGLVGLGILSVVRGARTARSHPLLAG